MSALPTDDPTPASSPMSAAALPAAAGGFIQVDPSQTYLDGNGDSSRPLVIHALADYGLVAGDVITVSRVGTYKAGTNLADTNTSLLMLFGFGTTPLAPEVYLERITQVQSDGSTTDLPQDFLVVGPGVTQVRIPFGATVFAFSVDDTFFGDNSDPDGDFGALIRKVGPATDYAGADLLYGTFGNDTLTGGAGADTMVGGPGNDRLDGGAVLDRVFYGDANTVSYAASAGPVTVDLSGIKGDGSAGSGFALDGFGGTDTLVNVQFVTGSRHGDAITGSAAMVFEILEGGAGDDTIAGGAIDHVTQRNGNRANYGNAEAAVTVDLAAGTATGGAGNDRLADINQIAGSRFADTLRGSDSVLVERLEGAGGNDTIDGRGGIDYAAYQFSPQGVEVRLDFGLADDGRGGLDTLLNIEGALGSRYDDVLVGGNPVNGIGAREGFEGFVGGAGNDTIIGGVGYDRAEYSNAQAGVVVNLATGSAEDGTGGTDMLVGIEGVRGSLFDDLLIGSDTAEFESFEGLEGDDTIQGNGGVDRADYNRMPEGVIVDLAAGTAADGGGGTDRLSGIEEVRGSFFDDVITGDARANALVGSEGDDAIAGGDGEDTLEGGAGADTLDGGAGNDRILLRSKTDSTVAAPDLVRNFADGDRLAFEGMAGVAPRPGTQPWAGSVAATVAAIDASAGVDATLNFFTDGTDGYVYVRGAGTGVDFGGTLLHLAGRTTAPGIAGLAWPELPAHGIAASNASRAEGDAGFTPFTFTVTRTGATLQGSSVDWKAESGTANAQDFVGGALPSGTLVFAAGEIAKTITVQVAGDKRFETDETFAVTLSAPVGGTLGAGASASGTIVNDDPSSGPGILVRGSAGNDTALTGTAGNDTIDGGAGLDRAVFASARAENTVTNLGGGVIEVAGPAGTDRLTGVERIAFSDITLGFDVDGTGGKAFRLYKAAYDREPDPEGLGFWLYYLDNGFDMVTAADNFLNQTEFRNMYDTAPDTPGYQEPSNEQYCYLVYKHVLQREPDPAGYRFWVGAMSNEGGIYGKQWSKGEVLILFAESDENQANTAQLIGQGFAYEEFTPG